MVTAHAFYSLRAADEGVPRAWAMYIGGKGWESAQAITTDAAGNIYVTGGVGSDAPGMPSTGASVLKFNPAGVLQYAIVVGGRVHDIAIGPDGAAYVVASRLALSDVFVARVTPSGSIASVTNIPGLTLNRSYVDSERPSIAVTASGTVVVAGRSESGVSGVPPTTIGPVGGEDAAVAFIDPRGVLTSAVLIGGSDADAARDVSVDTSGNIYVVGRTGSRDFPVSAQALRPPAAALACKPSSVVFDICDDAFIVKLDAHGALVFATYYGGSQADHPAAVGVDRNGGIYVAGFTSSRDFPTVHAVQTTSPSCPVDLTYSCSSTFVMRWNGSGTAVEFATYFGGTSSTTISGMAVDSSGNAYIAGVNRGNDLPVRRAPQPDNGAGPLILSEDGGRTWVMTEGLRANVAGIAWVGGGRPAAYAGTDRGLFVSADSGRHWTQLPAFAARSVGVVVDPVTPEILYATVPPDGLFKSLDGGRSWTEINNGLPAPPRYVSSIRIAPSQPSTLYAVAGTGVYASDDGGSNWRDTSLPATSVAVSPGDARRVYGASVTSGFNVSTDGGRTWRRTSPPLSGSGRRVGGIVVNPARPSEVYVGHEDGITRSRDGGDTWEFFGIGDIEHAFSVSIDPMHPDDVWTAGRSIMRLAAGGSSFTTVEGRFHFIGSVSPYNGRLLATAGQAPTGFVTAFNASGAVVWSTYVGGIGGNDSVTGVAAEGDRVYVTGTTISEVWPLAESSGRGFGGGSDLFLAGYVMPR